MQTIFNARFLSSFLLPPRLDEATFPIRKREDQVLLALRFDNVSITLNCDYSDCRVNQIFSVKHIWFVFNGTQFEETLFTAIERTDSLGVRHFISRCEVIFGFDLLNQNGSQKFFHAYYLNKKYMKIIHPIPHFLSLSLSLSLSLRQSFGKLIITETRHDPEERHKNSPPS